MLGSKAPNYDAYGLFRATHSHNPIQYEHKSGIYIPLLCSYWGGSQGLSPTYEQAHVGLDLLTLASIKLNYRKTGEHRDVIPILTGFMMSPYLQ